MRDSNKYIIPIKKNNTRGIDTVSLLVLALSYCSFLYKAVALYRPVEIIVIVIIMVASGVWYFNMRAGKWPEKHGYIIFIVAGLAWFYQTGAGFAIGAMVIVAGILQVRVKQAPIVTVDNECVAITNVFTRRYSWAELNNVVIKDGLLTVDCKNNRLFQKEVSADITEGYEAKFNEFCKLKIIHG